MVIQKLNLCTGENMVISAVQGQGQGFQGCYAPLLHYIVHCIAIVRALLSKIRNKISIGTLHVLFARIANFHVHT